MAGKELGRFKREKRAVSVYNQIRRELEEKTATTEVSDEERQRLLQEHLADSLVRGITLGFHRKRGWQNPESITLKA